MRRYLYQLLRYSDLRSSFGLRLGVLHRDVHERGLWHDHVLPLPVASEADRRIMGRAAAQKRRPSSHPSRAHFVAIIGGLDAQVPALCELVDDLRPFEPGRCGHRRSARSLQSIRDP